MNEKLLHQYWIYFANENQTEVASNSGRWIRKEGIFEKVSKTKILPMEADFDPERGELYSTARRNIIEPPDKQATEKWKEDNWGNIDWPKPIIYKAIQSLKSGSCIAVSDGSVLNGKAAHLWCLADSTPKKTVLKEVPCYQEKGCSIHHFEPKPWVYWQESQL